jgi:hypothetical protein
LLTSGEETRDSDFAQSENKQDQEYFESLVQKELTPSMRGFQKSCGI